MMGDIVKYYQQLKKDGYAYIAAEKVGGETAHKVKPVKSDKCGWVSAGWHFVVKPVEYKNIVKTGYMPIDEVIKLARKYEKELMETAKISPKARYMTKVYKRVCCTCGKPFETKASHLIYCSHDCRSAMLYIFAARRSNKTEEQMRQARSKYNGLVNLYLDRVKGR